MFGNVKKGIPQPLHVSVDNENVEKGEVEQKVVDVNLKNAGNGVKIDKSPEIDKNLEIDKKDDLIAGQDIQKENKSEETVSKEIDSDEDGKFPFEDEDLVEALSTLVKGEGYEDFEIEEKTVGGFIDKLKEKITADVKKDEVFVQSLRQEVIDKYGLDDQTLQTALNISKGVDIKEWNRALEMKSFSEYAFETEEEVKILFESYHKAIMPNQPKSVIDNYVIKDMASEDVGAIVAEYTGAIAKMAETKMNDLQISADAHQKAYELYADRKAKEFREILSKNKIGGYTFSQKDKDTYLSLIAPSTTEIELFDGSKIKVSKYEAMLHKEESVDPEKYLALKMRQVLGMDDLELTKKQESKERRERGALSMAMERVIKDKNLPNVSASKVPVNLKENEFIA